jgi:myo-inositol-1-phosphate synthase
LKDLVFGAWDIFPESAYDAALNAGVLEKELLNQLKEPLRKIKPDESGFRSDLRQALEWNQRQNRQEQIRN